MPDGPLELYKRRVADGALSLDPAQEAILAAFDALHDVIEALGPLPAPGGWLGRLFGRKPDPAPRGLYLYGDVGRGKSMMMDLFHESLGEAMSHRVHFHLFMREAHATLHHWREDGTPAPPGGTSGEADPIPRLARALTHGKRVLCLDEMDIQDIGDAMIVGRLFQEISRLGVVVATTSNRAPDDLYKNGLQRQKFLPFIEMMKERMEVLRIVSPTDHRLDHLEGMTVYITPPGEAANARLDAFMAELSDGETPAPASIVVDGRTLDIPSATSRAARFSFCDLCGTALGSHDYLALAERYDAVLIADVPLLSNDYRDEARRFVVLVDALYENGSVLICTAAAEPDKLYTEGQGAFEFQRTVSRLLEMQTDAYLTRARCERCKDCRDRCDCAEGGPKDQRTGRFPVRTFTEPLRV